MTRSGSKKLTSRLVTISTISLGRFSGFDGSRHDISSCLPLLVACFRSRFVCLVVVVFSENFGFGCV